MSPPSCPTSTSSWPPPALYRRLADRDRLDPGPSPEPQREGRRDEVAAGDRDDRAPRSGLLGHVPDDPEHDAEVRGRGDPQCRIACELLRLLAQRAGAVLDQRLLELVRTAAGDERAL